MPRRNLLIALIAVVMLSVATLGTVGAQEPSDEPEPVTTIDPAGVPLMEAMLDTAVEVIGGHYSTDTVDTYFTGEFKYRKDDLMLTFEAVICLPEDGSVKGVVITDAWLRPSYLKSAVMTFSDTLVLKSDEMEGVCETFVFATEAPAGWEDAKIPEELLIGNDVRFSFNATYIASNKAGGFIYKRPVSNFLLFTDVN